MKPIDFLKDKYACASGYRFAIQFETMAEVWDACERTDWLFWMLSKTKPLDKRTSVILSVEFASSVKQEDVGTAAINAAKKWLEDMNDENARAAEAAEAAAYAARASRAAYASYVAAAYAAEAAGVAAYAAYATGADAAADAAAAAAAAAAADADAHKEKRKELAMLMRSIVENPFK
jgi:hypothetical protein